MSFNTKSEILAAIAKTEDQTLKTVLLLMLGVFEDLGEKIDSVLRNETALRTMVLNGHEPVHHRHHEWINERMVKDDEINKLIEWVKLKMREEMELRANQKKVAWAAIEKVVTHVAVFASAIVLMLLVAPK